MVFRNNFKVFAICLAIVSVLGVLAAACVVPTPVRVEGSAMKPAFNDGDKVIMNQPPGEIARGDVIMFRFPKDQTRFYIKRVIALPGEKIKIKDGTIYINGAPLDEPYVDPEYNHTKADFAEETVTGGHYFTMGDNRDNSSDSRSWGTVSRELITGKYYMKYGSVKE
jgi:signal peptidase I